MKVLNIKRIGWLIVLGFTLLPLSFAVTNAQSGNEGVYIIYDSSNSMWGALPDTSRKYEAARSAMRELVGRDFGGRDVALRMYGHRRKNDCSDSQLVVPWSQPDNVAGDMVAFGTIANKPNVSNYITDKFLMLVKNNETLRDFSLMSRV